MAITPQDLHLLYIELGDEKLRRIVAERERDEALSSLDEAIKELNDAEASREAAQATEEAEVE